MRPIRLTISECGQRELKGVRRPKASTVEPVSSTHPESPRFIVLLPASIVSIASAKQDDFDVRRVSADRVT